MNNILSKFDGYKSYAAAAGSFLLGAYHFFNKDYATAQQFLLMGLGFAGLRHAIEKLK